MKIVLVRHGKHEIETHNGKLLNEGKKQARLLAKKFKKIQIKDIYSSDLKRAEETAKILEKELKIPVVTTSVLREWPREILKKDKIGWKKEYQNQFKRLNKFLNEITKNRKEDVIVMVVAHGQLNKLIMAIMLNIDIKRATPFMQDNSCVNVLEWNEHFKNWRLTLMNDTSHLNKNMDKLSINYRK